MPKYIRVTNLGDLKEILKSMPSNPWLISNKDGSYSFVEEDDAGRPIFKFCGDHEEATAWARFFMRLRRVKSEMTKDEKVALNQEAETRQPILRQIGVHVH